MTKHSKEQENSNEITTSKEQAQSIEPPSLSNPLVSEAQLIMEKRRKDLESLKNTVTLKLYYSLEEKLKIETQEFEQLLDFQKGKREILEQYSFVLDPHYFEQIFFQDK